MANLKDNLIDVLISIDESDLVAMHNVIADADDYIYQMFEFDEIVGGLSPSELANKIFYGNFNPNNEYFMFNGYANLESTNSPLNVWIFLDDIAEYIESCGEDFGNAEIAEVLKENEAG